MSSNKKFTDLFFAYNANISNLKLARQEFESELLNFIEEIATELDEANNRQRVNFDEKKLDWGNPEDWSSGKDGAWTRQFFGICIPVHIRPPGYTNFKKNAGKIFFIARFDEEFGKFMLQCIFINSDNRETCSEIDEKMFEIIKNDPECPFKNFKLIRSNEVILFRHELNDQLYADISKYIEKSLAICEQAIDALFPDCDYRLTA